MSAASRAMTEEEQDTFQLVGITFVRDLAGAASNALAHFPKEVRAQVKAQLQDMTSLYSPFTADLTQYLLDYIDDEAEGL